ncbi:NAD-dependent epimerase/dehydratase family protein [Leucobacter musarum]|uniref:NAD-dependent epimerase/dehydratase family protein n=1 Tax=Leucobacter musarum TaxID=1930747 RepID=UPI0006A7707E|nr:NAD-dependent epimerase/dehydratase family protein [Leucobacter musarum]
MHALITGAGQIGTQLARELSAAGHEVTVLRRGSGAVPKARVISGDAGDRDSLRAIATGAATETSRIDVIFHCIHAAYSAPVWRRELPQRELAVMDIAAELDVPVIFPESVYAYGRGAVQLHEHLPLAPVSPLGEVRAELLAARAAHSARTASVIASDLVGPTATARSSVMLGMVLTPSAAGRGAWVLGDPDAPHAVTTIPDLARAMIAAIPLASTVDTRLTAPTDAARSQRQMATDAARVAGKPARTTHRIPDTLFALAGPFSPMMREMQHQRYLWAAPSVIVPGRLTTELGLEPTPWEHTLVEWHTGRAVDPAHR